MLNYAYFKRVLVIKMDLLKHEITIYLSLIIALVCGFFVYLLVLHFYIDPYLENYSDLERGAKIFEFYEKQQDSNSIYYLGPSSVKEDINADLIQTQTPFYSHFNLGNPASTPVRRFVELEEIIDSKPSIVVFGVSYTSFSGKWLFPHDQYALISPYANEEAISFLYNETQKKLIGMSKLQLSVYKRKFIFPATENIFNRLRYLLLRTKRPYYYGKYNNDFKSEGILLQTEKSIDEDFYDSLKEKTNFEEYEVTAEGNIEKISFEIMIERFLDNNIKVIILRMPLNPELLKEINEQNKINMNNYLEIISKTYNLEILDYESVYAKEYFYDGHHLNKNGKQKFSEELSQVLSEVLEDVI